MTSFDAALVEVERLVGHEFRDRQIARSAFVHRSYMSEHDDEESYERLEFLGDAVLQLSVTGYLYRRYPELAEGEMAKVRASVVNERTLARLAREFELDHALLLGRGEEMTGGRRKDSILSDVVESVLGAVFLDAGFDRAEEVVLKHWAPIIDERALAPGRRDYKTRLQEYLAGRGLRPVYEIHDAGPEHAKAFTARVYADGDLLGEGFGTSKKRAEQDAARVAAERLGAGRDA